MFRKRKPELTALFAEPASGRVFYVEGGPEPRHKRAYLSHCIRLEWISAAGDYINQSFQLTQEQYQPILTASQQDEGATLNRLARFMPGSPE